MKLQSTFLITGMWRPEFSLSNFSFTSHREKYLTHCWWSCTRWRWRWLLTLHFAVHFKWFQRPAEIGIDCIVSRPILAAESVGLAWLFINRYLGSEMINLLLLERKLHQPSVIFCKETLIIVRRLPASTYTCDTLLLYSLCSHTGR